MNILGRTYECTRHFPELKHTPQWLYGKHYQKAFAGYGTSGCLAADPDAVPFPRQKANPATVGCNQPHEPMFFKSACVKVSRSPPQKDDFLRISAEFAISQKDCRPHDFTILPRSESSNPGPPFPAKKRETNCPATCAAQLAGIHSTRTRCTGKRDGIQVASCS